MTAADYGSVYVEFTPPSDINTSGDRALRKSLKNNVLRFFKKDTRSASIVLEIFDNQGAKIGAMPLALASVDTRTGVDVVDDIRLIQRQRMTSYVRLYDSSDAVSARITVVQSDKPTTEVVSVIKEVVDAAVGLGSSGWLASAASNSSIVTSLSKIEKRLNTHFSVAANSTLTIPLTFENASSLEYRFGFDPRPGAQQTGLLKVELRRRPSLWKERAVIAAMGSGSTITDNQPKVPDYETSGGYDDSVTSLFLSRPVTATETVAGILERRVGSTTWSNFRTSSVSSDTFNQACDAVRQAAAASELAFNPSDAMVVFWAAFVSSPNSLRSEVRVSPCIKSQLNGFFRHHLSLPDVEIAATPQGDSAAGDRLAQYIEKSFIPALSRSADHETKQRLLQAHFADVTGFKAEVSDNDLVSVGLNDLTSRESNRTIAKELAKADFAAGCFFPLTEKRTFLLARRSDGASTMMKSPLWVFELDVRQAERAGPLWIAAISIRDALDVDAMELAKNLPNLRRCHDLATAPKGSNVR